MPDRRSTARRLRFVRRGALPAEKREMMRGLFYILLCWLAGTGLSRLTGNYISGNIIGMVLLFGALCMKWIDAEQVRPAAKFLLGSMALFFVPYGVGLIESYRAIWDNLWTIVVAGVVSTAAVLYVTGRTYQLFNRKKARKNE